MFKDIPTFPLDTPAVRPLEIVPVRAQGQNLLMVRDPLDVLEGPALLVPDPLLLVFLQMADGRTTLGEMAQQVTLASGQIVPAGMFEQMAKQLDEALLLQSDRFIEALNKKYEDFINSPTRPQRIFKTQGMERLKMLKELGEEFRRHRSGHDAPPGQMDLPANAVTAILSPHIDYQRGGRAYAWAYQALKDHGVKAKRFIVLGTCHRPTTHRFIGTKKAFETPFGNLECDTALVEEFASGIGPQFFEEEYVHAEETTIELQAIYLKQIFGDADIKMTPILVSSFDDMLQVEGSPKQDPEIDTFCQVLRGVLDKYGDDVVLIGGVDFSHCGPEFGDEQLNDAARVKEIEAADRKAIAAIEAVDAEAFFDSYRADQNANKVCSVAAIYCVLDVMKGRATGKLLSYQQANSEDKNTLVSFASVAFIKSGVELKPKSRIILLS